MNRVQQVGISINPDSYSRSPHVDFYRGNYGLKPTDFPNAYAANYCGISLLLFNGMTKAKQPFVIEQIAGKIALCVA